MEDKVIAALRESVTSLGKMQIDAAATFAKAFSESSQMQLQLAQAFATTQSGVRDALLYLAGAIAKQENINVGALLRDFSFLVEMNHPDDVPVSVLDVRAVLSEIAQSRS